MCQEHACFAGYKLPIVGSGDAAKYLSRSRLPAVAAYAAQLPYETFPMGSRPRLSAAAASRLSVYRFANTFMAFRRFTEVCLMIRSDVGVTERITLVAGTVFGRDPSPRVFTTFLECVLLTDSGFFSFFAIRRTLRSSSMFSRGVGLDLQHPRFDKHNTPPSLLGTAVADAPAQHTVPVGAQPERG